MMLHFILHSFHRYDHSIDKILLRDLSVDIRSNQSAEACRTSGTDAPRVGMGKRLFSFIEIADNEYLVETRELEEIGRGN